MKVLLASGNTHKLQEFKELMGQEDSIFSIVKADESLEVDETGGSYTENAYLKAKAYYDLYKTLNWLKNKGITKLDIIGADGKRPDHMIANFDIIFKKINHFNIKIFTDYGIFYTVDKEKIFENCLNKKISIFSPDQNNKITSNGLKYELKNKQLTYLYEGSLNQAIKNKITIKTKHEIFVFISK